VLQAPPASGFWGDVVLYLHAVPMMMALAVRPHLDRDDSPSLLNVANAGMVVVWWIYLYLYFVTPWREVANLSMWWDQNYNVVYGAANISLAVLAGIALNAVPIALNGGMPVEASAIVRAHIATREEVPDLQFGTKRHLATDGDHARWLDDRFPDWVTHRVLSIGDLVIGVGVGAVTAGLLHPATGRKRRRQRRAHAAHAAKTRFHLAEAAAEAAAG